MIETRKLSIVDVAAPGPNSLATGPFGSSIGARFFQSSGVPVIRGGNLSSDSIRRLCDENLVFLHPEKAAQFKRCTVRAGDLIFTCWGTISQIGLIDDNAAYSEYVISNKQMKLTPDPAVASPEFLYYLFSSPSLQRQILEGAIGSSVPGFNLTRLRSMKIVIPPIEKQRDIAATISQAESLERSIMDSIAKKKAVKRGVMQQLLTGRTRLPGFDAKWASIKLGDHVTYIRNVALSRAQLDGSSLLRYLHYGDIHTRQGNCLDASQEPMPRAATELVGRAERLQVGDLILADASEDLDGVGKSVEVTGVPSDGVVAGLHTIAARFDKLVLTDGFKCYLQHVPDFKRQLLRLTAGTKVMSTTRGSVSGVRLLLPKVDEQRAIAQVLDHSQAEIEVLLRHLDKARAIKVGMMQQFLSGRTQLSVEAPA